MSSIINDRRFKQFPQVCIYLFDFGLLRHKGFGLRTCAVGQFSQRFLEINPLALHYELEDVAALIALAKTTPRPRLRPDHEGRRMLVVVERTEPRVISAGMAQLHTRLRHEVND